MQSIAIVLAIGVFFGAIGAYLAEKKGRKHYEGFLLGFLFGLLGVVIEMMLSSKKRIVK
mgnify:FL=1|jgi:hypothetical protein|tara:strand:- start:4452 stop:4628 length:177 start_codon:yes stop_codon:yes gene_type:complete